MSTESPRPESPEAAIDRMVKEEDELNEAALGLDPESKKQLHDLLEGKHNAEFDTQRPFSDTLEYQRYAAHKLENEKNFQPDPKGIFRQGEIIDDSVFMGVDEDGDAVLRKFTEGALEDGTASMDDLYGAHEASLEETTEGEEMSEHTPATAEPPEAIASVSIPEDLSGEAALGSSGEETEREELKKLLRDVRAAERTLAIIENRSDKNTDRSIKVRKEYIEEFLNKAKPRLDELKEKYPKPEKERKVEQPKAERPRTLAERIADGESMENMSAEFLKDLRAKHETNEKLVGLIDGELEKRKSDEQNRFTSFLDRVNWAKKEYGEIPAHVVMNALDGGKRAEWEWAESEIKKDEEKFREFLATDEQLEKLKAAKLFKPGKVYSAKHAEHVLAAHDDRMKSEKQREPKLSIREELDRWEGEGGAMRSRRPLSGIESVLRAIDEGDPPSREVLTRYAKNKRVAEYLERLDAEKSKAQKKLRRTAIGRNAEDEMERASSGSDSPAAESEYEVMHKTWLDRVARIRESSDAKLERYRSHKNPDVRAIAEAEIARRMREEKAEEVKVTSPAQDEIRKGASDEEGASDELLDIDGIPTLTERATPEELRQAEIAEYKRRWEERTEDERRKFTGICRFLFRDGGLYRVKRTDGTYDDWTLSLIRENGEALVSTTDEKGEEHSKVIPLEELYVLNTTNEAEAPEEDGGTSDAQWTWTTPDGRPLSSEEVAAMEEKKKDVETEDEAEYSGNIEELIDAKDAKPALFTPEVIAAYENGFRIKPETLREIEEFKALTPGQQLLVSRDLNQFMVSRIRAQALKDYHDRLDELKPKLSDGERRFLGEGEGKGWLNNGIRKLSVGLTQFTKKETWQRAGIMMTKGKQLSDREKALAEEMLKGDVDQTEYIRELAKMAKDGPDAELKDGKLHLYFVKESDFSGELTEEEKKTVENFNRVADDFMHDMPNTGHGATDALREVYKEKKDAYDKALATMLELKQKKGGNDGVAAFDTLDLDRKITFSQLLNAYPDANRSLSDVRDQSSMWRLLKTMKHERGGALALGASMRTAAALVSSSVGVAALPAIMAPVAGYYVGKMSGRKRALAELNEREILAKMGVKDESEEARTNIIAAEKLVAKIARLKGAIDDLDEKLANEKVEDEAAALRERREKLIDSLEARYAFTKEKLDMGLVNFGNKESDLKNRYQLIRALGDAAGTASVERQWEGELHDRLHRFMGNTEKRITDKQHAFVERKEKQAAKYGAIFAGAGYIAADMFHGLLGGHSVTAEVWNEMQGKGVSGGAESAAPSAPAGPIEHGTVSSKPEYIDEIDRITNADTPAPSAPSAAVESAAIYDVRSGDTLSAIIKEHIAIMDDLPPQGQNNVVQNLIKGLTPEEMKEIGITDPNKIEIGQHIDLQNLSIILHNKKIGDETLLDHAAKLYGAKWQHPEGMPAYQNPGDADQALATQTAGIHAVERIREAAVGGHNATFEQFISSHGVTYAPHEGDTLFAAIKDMPPSSISGRPELEVAQELKRYFSPDELHRLGVSSGDIDHLSPSDKIDLRALHELLSEKERAFMDMNTAKNEKDLIEAFIRLRGGELYSAHRGETLASITDKELPAYSGFSGRKWATISPDLIRRLTPAEVRSVGVSSGNPNDIHTGEQVNVIKLYELLRKKEYEVWGQSASAGAKAAAAAPEAGHASAPNGHEWLDADASKAPQHASVPDHQTPAPRTSSPRAEDIASERSTREAARVETAFRTMELKHSTEQQALELRHDDMVAREMAAHEQRLAQFEARRQMTEMNLASRDARQGMNALMSGFRGNRYAGQNFARNIFDSASQRSTYDMQFRQQVLMEELRHRERLASIERSFDMQRQSLMSREEIEELRLKERA